MAEKGSTTIILGSPDEDYAINPRLVMDRTLHINITDHAVLVFHNPAEMHNFAEQIEGAAQNWDAKEASRAGVDHN